MHGMPVVIIKSGAWIEGADRGDSHPMQIGKDTYSISVRVPVSGPSRAKGQALQEANAFCAKQNRQVLLDHENSYGCALPGDRSWLRLRHAIPLAPAESTCVAYLQRRYFIP